MRRCASWPAECSRSARCSAARLGGLIGLPLTLVVASVGMLLAFLWLLLSPVRALRVLP